MYLMSVITRIIIIIFFTAMLALFLAVTSPNEIPGSLLLVPFGLIAAIFFNLLMLMTHIFRILSSNKGKQRGLATLFSVVLTNFLVLQSIGDLTAQDIFLISLITLIVVLYVAKFHISSR
jgi:hypothetical protein